MNLNEEKQRIGKRLDWLKILERVGCHTESEKSNSRKEILQTSFDYCKVIEEIEMEKLVDEHK